jgi:hypothetical protein
VVVLYEVSLQIFCMLHIQAIWLVNHSLYRFHYPLKPGQLYKSHSHLSSNIPNCLFTALYQVYMSSCILCSRGFWNSSHKAKKNVSHPHRNLSKLLLLFSRLYSLFTSSCTHLLIILSFSSSCVCCSSLPPPIPFHPPVL